MLADMKNIVLVHGAWADSSGWQAVHDLLDARGYDVSVVQNPLTSFADDVAAADRVLARQDGATLLVGHCYGGAVITQAGNAANVAGLVYVAAFAPDGGESVASLMEGEAPALVQPSADGFLFVNPALFPQVFAHDLTTVRGVFLAAAQLPPAGMALGTPVSQPAWRSKRCWYVLATEDRVIPPAAQRNMAMRANAAITDVRGSHVVQMSQPRAVAEAIAAAARAAGPSSDELSLSRTNDRA
jgi:pimeloyl-ACP methyl ester carboxylesterase